ncbi:quinol:cytochrome C oxidoreductase [Xanthomarina sp.]|uniref:quinol:cytochrome C oxidoreductase n=1 Tax=Xanthomarina sp. TaxID=1931211 RepID=UPI002CE9E29F|nr:quinol:cytochrome C oxidoreductase [Xanthomarina sp.]HLV38744.1 hypothetical protein [Xanthomarina sp.]
MYTFSNKLKTFSIALMILGLLGVGYGFMTSHKSFEDVETMLAEEASHHGEDHAVAGVSEHSDNGHETKAQDASAQVDEHTKHVEHVQHQIANRPWSALYVAAFFFFMIAIGVLSFYAIQIASQSGWSPVLFRVMEGLSAYVLPGGVIVLAIALASGIIGDYNLFVWMNPDVVADDKLLQGKASWLSIGWFAVRGVIFIAGWSLYSYFARKFSKANDTATDNSYFKKAFRISAGFLVFFIYTESIMSWDWIMSIDPHWFSTLFGWYVWAGMAVTGITVIAFVALYLKSKGYLEVVNDSHIHDLAKYMFGFSIFWAYLWFSQFMLIWYANIPEEVTYFITRVEDYNLLFFGMLVLNFVFPFLVLMNSDYKRLPWFVAMSGVIVLIGHYINVYVMIMPGTVGDRWGFGIPEIGSVMLFLGLFLFIVFTALTKAPLVVKRNPFLKESEHFHY